MKVLLSLDTVNDDDSIWTQLLKLSEDTCNDPEQVVSEVLVVTLSTVIDSEKVTEILSLTETELWLSVGEVEETVGAFVSIVKGLTVRALLWLLALSVTLMVQVP